jgi:hypothetical protein
MLISLSDNLKYSLNYVMYECRGVVLYSTLYTIGTYGYSSKSVALRFMVKSFYGVGNSAVNNKPYNNIDDGSTTFKVTSYSNMISNDKVSYC